MHTIDKLFCCQGKSYIAYCEGNKVLNKEICKISIFLKREEKERFSK